MANVGVIGGEQWQIRVEQDKRRAERHHADYHEGRGQEVPLRHHGYESSRGTRSGESKSKQESLSMYACSELSQQDVSGRRDGRLKLP